MTKSLRALCVFFCILLIGCDKAASVTPITEFTADFTAEYRGQSLEGSLTYSRQDRMNLRLATPDSLAGLSVGYNAATLRISKEGLQCTADEAYLPPESFPASIKSALDAVSREVENEEVRIKDNITADGWEVTFNSEGFPQTLQNNDINITLSCQRAL
ncbi:MAG: hypothetical protein IJ598_09685 [Ruminococcus sp.]|nr:hypothetical protein [Ruminococcus sp.]